MKEWYYIIVGLLLLIPKRLTGRNDNYDIPRGIRNNNPGNIKINPFNQWQGKVNNNTDGTFEQFNSMVWGVRALIVLLENYRLQGNDTIYRIIKRYAPDSENPTNTYIAFMENCTSKDKHEIISRLDYDFTKNLVLCISNFENGIDTFPYINPVFDQAYNMADV